jgi:hypothetical protein
MARCKNVGGAPSDGDKSPPRLTEVARGKHKKTSTKKRKRQLTEAEEHRQWLTLLIVLSEEAKTVVFRLVSVTSTLRGNS